MIILYCLTGWMQDIIWLGWFESFGWFRWLESFRWFGWFNDLNDLNGHNDLNELNLSREIFRRKRAKRISPGRSKRTIGFVHEHKYWD
jgi:hypothetical protein